MVIVFYNSFKTLSNVYRLSLLTCLLEINRLIPKAFARGRQGYRTMVDPFFGVIRIKNLLSSC